MKKTLDKAAKHGRYGDDKLLHVSQSEIDGLASLVPGGRLPINPKTGLPEAFFFLPFLAALGAAAPAAAAAAAPAALGTAALGTAAAAAPAALTAATALPAAATGLAGLGAAAAPTAASVLPAAATTAASALPTAAAAIPTATSALGSGVAGSGIASGLGGGAGFLGGVPMAAAPSAAALPTAAAAPGIAGALPGAASASPLVSAPAAAASPYAISAPISTAGELAAGTTASGVKTGLGSLLGGMDTGKLLQYGALGAMMLPKGGGGKSKDDGSSKDVGAKQYDRGDQASAPDGGDQGGTSSEFKYFPGAHYYAQGGIASLGGPQGAPQGGQGGPGDEQLIDATIAAIQGQTPNSQAVIQQFVQEFGPDALKDLIAKVQGGQSQSDGLSDSVPAQINSGIGGLNAPAQLSEGEYVVPSDVVSHLGNGSTQAGERQLNQMRDRVRQQRGASAPQAIDPSQVMPA